MLSGGDTDITAETTEDQLLALERKAFQALIRTDKTLARIEYTLETGQPAAELNMARRFHIVLIKPSHYDDDGYVIQWRRSSIPSNSLASVHGLLAACAESACSGPMWKSRSRPMTNATPSST